MMIASPYVGIRIDPTRVSSWGECTLPDRHRGLRVLELVITCTHDVFLIRSSGENLDLSGHGTYIDSHPTEETSGL
jgi:hypothetical protein